MPYREQIPIDTGIDNTVKLLLEGYNYITNRRNQFGRDIFETRLLGGEKAICVAGKEAVNMFYDEKKLILRRGSAEATSTNLIWRACDSDDGWGESSTS